MKKKTVIIALLSVLILGVAFFAFVLAGNRTFQSQMTVEPTGSMSIGPLPVIGDKNEVELAPGLRFRLDSGSSFSSISREQLDSLKSMGYPVDSTGVLAMGLGYKGQFRLVTKRYRVTLPVYGYHFGAPDSTGVYPEPVMDVEAGPVAKFVNVDFVMVLDNNHASPLLGIDFLEHFVMEMCYYPRCVTLRRDVPEKYDYVGELVVANNLKDYLWVGSRYYMDLSVNHVRDMYLVDTGMERATIKAPTSMRPKHRNKDRHDSMVSSVGVRYTAVVDGNVWVEYGNRAVGSSTYYYEDEEEPFAINPLNFFRWEAVIDFPSRKVYTSRRNKTHEGRNWIL